MVLIHDSFTQNVDRHEHLNVLSTTHPLKAKHCWKSRLIELTAAVLDPERDILNIWASVFMCEAPSLDHGIWITCLFLMPFLINQSNVKIYDSSLCWDHSIAFAHPIKTKHDKLSNDKEWKFVKERYTVINWGKRQGFNYIEQKKFHNK